jgi:hypothetical protein
MGEAALQLARLGWHVLPLAVGTKRALTRWGLGVAPDDPDFATRLEALLGEKEQALAAKGQRLRSREPAAHLDLFRASADAALVRGWWRRWPDAGIGVACGPSSLLVLDVDRHGAVDGAATLAGLIQDHGPPPPTVAQRTGGGDRWLDLQALARASARAGVLAEAAKAGWTELDLAGCHPARPISGLTRWACCPCWVARRAPSCSTVTRWRIEAIDAASATLVNARGARQSFRRRALPPGTVPLWLLPPAPDARPSTARPTPPGAHPEWRWHLVSSGWVVPRLRVIDGGHAGSAPRRDGHG